MDQQRHCNFVANASAARQRIRKLAQREAKTKSGLLDRKDEVDPMFLKLLYSGRGLSTFGPQEDHPSITR
jgi:hypothetical protein